MAEAQRDGNQVTTLIGSYNGVAVNMKVDTATGYLKAVIYNQVLSPPSVTPSDDAKDDNGVSSALGTYSGSPKPLMVTNADGYLRAVNN